MEFLHELIPRFLVCIKLLTLKSFLMQFVEEESEKYGSDVEKVTLLVELYYVAHRTMKSL